MMHQIVRLDPYTLEHDAGLTSRLQHIIFIESHWFVFYSCDLTEFSRPVSTLGEIHDGLSQKSESELPQCLSADEAEPDLSLDQDQDQDQDLDVDQTKSEDMVTTPTRKKDIKVILYCIRWSSSSVFPDSIHLTTLHLIIL